MKWQPIVTGPSDGRIVLAARKPYADGLFWPIAVRWSYYHGSGDLAWRDQRGHKIRGLTHWMPCPRQLSIDGRKKAWTKWAGATDSFTQNVRSRIRT